ncbi:hypothetical protein [Yersinia enterocolitica]|uniref:hypothetical protein n=1 Tax=Yersinia enterocolitica TaxID=630 RepID=UPI00090926E4|nr:hypothetical protein [Yersinia enterocolitica]
MARKDDRNSLGGFHHGSGAIAPIKKPDIWLQYLSAIFKKKHLVYWERPYRRLKETGYMAAIPERYFQEKTLGLLGASIYGGTSHQGRLF